mgnify:CR=1 FL=1
MKKISNFIPGNISGDVKKIIRFVVINQLERYSRTTSIKYETIQF